MTAACQESASEEEETYAGAPWSCDYTHMGTP